MLISTQLAQRDLGLDPADGALFIGQTVGLRGDVDGDLRRVGQELVQMLLLTSAELLQRAAVRVIAGVSLLAVRHRQVLRAEGGVRLKAVHTAIRPGNTPGGKIVQTKVFCCLWLMATEKYRFKDYMICSKHIHYQSIACLVFNN